MRVGDVFKLPVGSRIFVNVNEYGQPIRVARKVLTRYMTKMIQQPNICPPDLKDFKELKNLCVVELLRAVRQKFSFPWNENVDRVLIAMLDSKYRVHKYRLRNSLYEKARERLKNKLKDRLELDGVHGEELDMQIQMHKWSSGQIEEELDQLQPPAGFANHQWIKFKSTMKSEKVKEIVHKEQPGPLKFFDLTHKKKDGSYAKNESRAFMVKAQSELEKLKAAGTNDFSTDLESSVWLDLMGEDRPGQARGHGIGVTKSNLTSFHSKLNKMRNEEVESRSGGAAEFRQLQIQFSLQQQLEQQREVMHNYMAKTNDIISTLRGEICLYRTAFGPVVGDSMHATNTWGTGTSNPVSTTNTWGGVTNIESLRPRLGEVGY